MGILNLSAGSFSSVGRATNLSDAVKHAKKMVEAGVDIIDIGAEPTHPANNQLVSEEAELNALIPLLQALVNEIAVPISIDTSRPRVMAAAVAAGAQMINDVRALRVPGALETVAALNVPVSLMHMRYLSLPASSMVIEDTSQPALPVMDEIITFLQQRIAACEAAGIARERLVIDPGIGAGSFGKTTAENLQILRELPSLQQLQLPVLAGASRKKFIGEILNIPAADRLAGSLATAIAIQQGGCQIIRVHDVAETIQTIKMMQAIYG